MSSVAIVTDSTADIPGEIAEQLGITIVPLNIRIGGESYEDRVSIMPETFMRLLADEDGQPVTSSPSVGRFAREFERLGETHDQILSIHVSSKLSGTFSTACTARDLFLDGPEIRIIDSSTASMGMGLVVIAAARLAHTGATIDELERAVNGMLARTHVIFLVDTLEHLRRGGRIGRAAEIIGSVLKLKPLLRIEEGIVVPQARTRTRARAVSGLVHLVSEIPRIKSAAIMHTSGADDMGVLAESLTPKLGEDELIIAELSPVLSAHIGPNGLGVAILEEEGA
jgi:DegV family protein with EDD domain